LCHILVALAAADFVRLAGRDVCLGLVRVRRRNRCQVILFVNKSRRNDFAALLVYVGISVGFFGRHLLRHSATAYVGEGTDPSQMMWLLVWWPYALIHRINPFLTRAVWAPSGANLAWMTCIPAPSLLAFPATYAFGPVVSYNLLSLLGPALSAFAAYCLCRAAGGAFVASLIGGYFYGFSSYEVGQVLGGHLSLSLVFLPPILAALFIRFAAGVVSRRRFAAWFTTLLALQFLISNEVLATATLFGLLAVALAWCLGDSSIRWQLRRAAPVLLICYILAAIALSPYLYYMFAYQMPSKPLYPPDAYSADLAGFIVPNILNYFRYSVGGLDARHFLIDPWENGAFVGIPILILIAWYVVEDWGTFAAKLLAAFLFFVCLAALGPVLHVAGQPSLALPWSAALHLPLLKHALPGRFMLYFFLGGAVAIAMWISRTQTAAKARFALVILCAVSLWPSATITKTAIPPFFTSGTYRYFLRPGENVLIVPFGQTGDSMLWQAETLMYFRMAGGWLGPMPAEYEHWPIVQALLSSVLMPEPDLQLKAFLLHYGIHTVVLDDAVKGPWRRLFSSLDTAPVRLGQVTVYRTAAGRLSATPPLNPLQAEGRANLERFGEMLAATTEYLRRGLDPAKLNCARAQQLGLIPDRGESRVTSNQLGWCYSMWFGVLRAEDFGLGLIGDYPGLRPVVARYKAFAKDIFYPYPRKMDGNPEPDQVGALIMTFDRERLVQAAAAAASAQVAAGRDWLPPWLQPNRQQPVKGWLSPKAGAADRALPIITAVNGVSVSPAAGADVDRGTVGPVLAARRARWGPWWKQVQADNLVMIEGHNFDDRFGIAVDIYCRCPGGEVGPFFFEPRYNPFDETRIFLGVSLYGSKAPLAGAGSIVVSNRGSDGQYSAKSNRVPVWIGPPAGRDRRASR
jgi:hypothetical protein